MQFIVISRSTCKPLPNTLSCVEWETHMPGEEKNTVNCGCRCLAYSQISGCQTLLLKLQKYWKASRHHYSASGKSLRVRVLNIFITSVISLWCLRVFNKAISIIETMREVSEQDVRSIKLGSRNSNLKGVFWSWKGWETVTAAVCFLQQISCFSISL